METKRNLTCIVCPIGCGIEVLLDDGKVIDVKGNTCLRGKEYAINECTNPQRLVTSTIKCTDGDVVPCKTDRAIPKDKIFECMEIINRTTVAKPIKIGDVLIGNVFGSKIVATGRKD